MPLDPFEKLERTGRGWFVPVVLVVAGAIGTTVAVNGVHDLTLIEADDARPGDQIEPQMDPVNDPVNETVDERPDELADELENQADVMAMLGHPLTPEPTVS